MCVCISANISAAVSKRRRSAPGPNIPSVKGSRAGRSPADSLNMRLKRQAPCLVLRFMPVGTFEVPAYFVSSVVIVKRAYRQWRIRSPFFRSTYSNCARVDSSALSFVTRSVNGGCKVNVNVWPASESLLTVRVTFRAPVIAMTVFFLLSEVGNRRFSDCVRKNDTTPVIYRVVKDPRWVTPARLMWTSGDSYHTFRIAHFYAA